MIETFNLFWNFLIKTSGTHDLFKTWKYANSDTNNVNVNTVNANFNIVNANTVDANVANAVNAKTLYTINTNDKTVNANPDKNCNC